MEYLVISVIYKCILYLYFSVNVSQFMLDKLVSRLVMPAGNCIVWSMASSLMAKCHLTKPLVGVMTVLTPSSVKLVQGNMYQEQSSLTWNPQ